MYLIGMWILMFRLGAVFLFTQSRKARASESQVKDFVLPSSATLCLRVQVYFPTNLVAN